uniref:Uncharacterized protein n=1 Tax=Arundo donax TaxID=35708 RepID=A0A0A8XRB4_ARUDO
MNVLGLEPKILPITYSSSIGYSPNIVLSSFPDVMYGEMVSLIIPNKVV